MFNKKNLTYFSVLFLPMLIISVLLNIVYSLQVHDYIQLNWIAVIILAVGLNTFFTWQQNRKKENIDNQKQ